jgi:membrane fusion protein, heavy metal efflux system
MMKIMTITMTTSISKVIAPVLPKNMKRDIMQGFRFLWVLLLIAASTSCSNNRGSHGHSHDAAGGHSTVDGHDHETMVHSYTLFSENHELFVEFEPLVAGQITTFAAHVTQLDDYKPVSEGNFTVSLIKGNKGIRHRADAPSSPGIFRPALKPEEPGTYKLRFEFMDEGNEVFFGVEGVQVYADAHDVGHASESKPMDDEITFLKEQAWKSEFAAMTIDFRPFYSVIHTSGRVKIRPQSETMIYTQTQGKVQLMVMTGESVKKGDLLAWVTGSGIDGNINLQLNERRLAFEKSRSDYIRTKPLAEKQAISQKDFLEIQARYHQDSLRYHQLTGLVSKEDGLRITAPMDGFISNLVANHGQFLEPGSPILKISNPRQLLIETHVNQSDFQKVNEIFDANFIVKGHHNPLTLKELNGEIVSKNAFVDDPFTRIPVIFSASGNDVLMPGMFLEAFLFTGHKENALLVPISALIEEHGLYFVFVQKGGESYEKRMVAWDASDGTQVEITSGLIPGERVVTKGAYQIKLASMSGELPLHGHTH